MFQDLVLSYLEAMKIDPTFMMRSEDLGATESLALLVFRREYARWLRERQSSN